MKTSIYVIAFVIKWIARYMANRRTGTKTARTAKNKKAYDDDLKSIGKSNYKIIALVIVLVLVSIAFYHFLIVPPTNNDNNLIINRDIVFPRDGGEHDELMETWTFGGLFEDQNGKKFGYQARYWNTGRRDVVLTDETNSTGSPFYYSRDYPTEEAEPSRNIQVSNKSLDLTYTNDGINDRWVEFENESFRYSFKSSMNIPTADFLVLDLVLKANKEPLLFGNGGKISLENYGTMFIYQQSNVSMTGTMLIDGKSYFVTGFGRIDHAWGSWQISGMEIWNIMLSNGKELSISRIFEPVTGSIFLEFDYLINDGDDYDVTLYSDVIPFKANYTYEEYQSQNHSIEVNNYWIDATDSSRTRCFIHDCTFISKRNHYNLEIKPTVEYQRSYEGYVGTVDVSGTFNGQRVTGRGYVTLINHYSSSLDIFSVEDNSDYLMNYEIPNDPVHVTATIIDGIPLTEATLYYRVNGGNNLSLPMELLNETNDEWGAVIPGQSLGTSVEYWIYAEDMATKWARTEIKSYEVRIGTLLGG